MQSHWHDKVNISFLYEKIIRIETGTMPASLGCKIELVFISPWPPSVISRISEIGALEPTIEEK